MWSMLGGLTGILLLLIGVLWSQTNDSLKTLEAKKASKEFVTSTYKDAVDRDGVTKSVALHLDPVNVKIKNIESDITEIKDAQNKQHDQFNEFQKSLNKMMGMMERIDERTKKE
jgi:hypothetical protein